MTTHKRIEARVRPKKAAPNSALEAEWKAIVDTFKSPRERQSAPVQITAFDC